MKRLEIVQIGFGHVGRKVAQIVLEERKRWREHDGLEVRYRAVSDTSGALTGEELLPQAIRLVRQHERATASLLQRRLRIGYSKAAQLIDLLEQRGIVGPAEGGRSREVLEGDDRPAGG